jgi:hypothetical protein
VTAPGAAKTGSGWYRSGARRRTVSMDDRKCLAPQPIPATPVGQRGSSEEHWLVDSNARHNARRIHNQEGLLPECVGTSRCKDPKRVALSGECALAHHVDQAS